MEMSFEKNSESMTVKVREPLTAVTSPEFQEKVLKEADFRSRLIIDIGEVEYISSAALRAFLTIQSKMRDGNLFALKNPNETIQGILKETGISRIINVI